MKKRTVLMIRIERYIHTVLFVRTCAKHCAFLLLFFFGAAGIVAAEEIERFESAVTVHQDATLTVTETIRYDFGVEDRRGIFREILTGHPQDASVWYKERYIAIDVTDVVRDGSPEEYTVTKERDRVRIRIGDPDKRLIGEHVYEITYMVRGGLSYFPLRSNAELYWNATGNKWEVPILQSTITLHDPDGLFLNERACYRGYKGETGSCRLKKQSGDGDVVFTTGMLRPGEEVTVAQSIEGVAVETVTLERFRVLPLFIGGLVAWFIFLGIFVYRYRTKHKIDRPVVAQFEPYQDYKPMYTGLLFDGKLHPRDITAGIVYLAEQGYLKIEQLDRTVLFFFTVDDYKITLTKSPDTLERPFQRDVLRLLFGDGMRESASVTLSDLKDDLSKQKRNQKILKDLKKDLAAELKQDGFYEVNIPKRYITAIGIASVIGIFSVGSALVPLLPQYTQSNTETMVLFVFWVIVGSAVILAFMYRRRTRKGYEALNHLEGFKQFLSVTEKDRYAFHNAPEKSPEQFMQYLPYAVAFGVEEEWASLFADISMPSPDWYSGAAAGSQFSATNLTQSLDGFSSAFTSSSGTSASSGGGSAGGGAGGGGGGSW